MTDLDVIQRYLGRRLTEKETLNFGQFMMTQAGKATVKKARKELAASRKKNKAKKAVNKPAKQKEKLPFVATKEFLESYEWRQLRVKVLNHYGPRCMCCGATPEHGVKMHVDHIKPRRKYPELALSFDNLQVLCEECNHGKGNWNETDWRPNHDASKRVTDELMAHLRSL